ncbi:MAG: hypothetical protein ABJN36_09325 [Cyclobacteriaceae bacterium]
MNKHFDISRFWMLMRLELVRSKRAIAMLSVIVFGMLFFVGMLLSLAVEKHTVVYDPEESYAFTLIVGGFVITSLAFSELSSKLKRYNFLMLPVSALERFLCMWILTTIGWILFYTLVYTVFSLVANPIGHMIYNKVQFLDFNPLGSFALTTMKYYVVSQGIFLVGAAHFKGYVFPKTLFVLILFAVVCGAIIYFGLRDQFLCDHYCNVSTGECELVETAETHVIWEIIQGAFWWALAPLSWLTTYLGLKGQEV